MTWLILEMLLALAVIVGIMVWTLKTRTDTPIETDERSGELPGRAGDAGHPSKPDDPSTPRH